MKKHTFYFILIVCAVCVFSGRQASAVTAMSNYCSAPPFVSQSVPPLVMLVAGRDEKLYTQAYNDAMDLDEDGRFDVGYVHSLDYYGYFDPNKCYTYSSTTATDGKFSPVADTADKFCSSSGGQWSGNVLNWASMSRIDVVRKVLYGGSRVTPETTGASATTTLQRAYIPQDTHSWGKELTGKLCTNGSTYKSNCYTDLDCFTAYGTGYSCVDKSMQLIGMAAATAGACSAAAVVSPWNVAGKMLVARYWNYRSSGGTDHADLYASYDTDTSNVIHNPLSLADINSAGTGGTSTTVDYISDFSAPLVDPSTAGVAYTNLLVVADFKTPNVAAVAGTWQFAIDGDDGVELEIIASPVTASSTGTIVATYYGAHSAWFTGTNNPNTTAFKKMCSLDQTQTCTADTDCTATSTGLCNYQQTSEFNSLLGTGGYTIARNTTYRLIARAANGTGQNGVRVWYKLPGTATWILFGTDTSANALTLTAPKIVPNNDCAIRYKDFVKNGTTTTSATAAKRHLFCNTNTSATGAPLMRFLHDRAERSWHWASVENVAGDRTMCGTAIDTNNNGTANSATGDTVFTVETLSANFTTANAGKLWDYVVKSEVCKTGTGLTRESNCRPYTNTSTAVTTYKPSGLLQKYGEDTTGAGKVCSRSYSKTCTADSDCANSGSSTDEGLCIAKAPMYFGLLTGSYEKNLSGGILHKNIWNLTDEITMTTGAFIPPPATNNATNFNTTFPQGSIIQAFEALKVVGYDYPGRFWGAASDGGCGWFGGTFTEGTCRMWGNPVSEMMYETLRYFAGKTSPTAAFLPATDSGKQDGTLPLYTKSWGVVRGSNTFRPYGDNNSYYPIYPTCSKPFMLVISEENNSQDSDSVPGSKFATYNEDAGVPLLNINVETQTDVIGLAEEIEGASVLIGEQTGTTNAKTDKLCTAVTVNKLSLLRGVCPDEPTQKGSYYAAGVAYYGNTLFKTNTGKPNVTTSSIVLASPVPKLVFNVNGKTVNVVPTGRTTNGSCNTTNCSMSQNADGSLNMGCNATAVCQGNGVTAVYPEEMQYSNTNLPPYTASNPAPELVYAKVRINFNDAELGGDNDMDTIISYEICVGSACSPAVNADQLKINVSKTYAQTSTAQMLGFIISGTSADGTYLVQNNTNAYAVPAFFSSYNGPWSKTFTASSTTTAKLLNNPLWYAAKWGAFDDADAPTNTTGYVPKPNLTKEWAKNDGVTPDNYYLVVNPLKLERQLDKAMTDILARVSSGTASSILNNSEGSGASLLQAVFYPKKTFDNSTEGSWVGEIQDLWYYLDPFFQKTSIREDSDKNYTLSLKTTVGASPAVGDKVANFWFDTSDNQTKVSRFYDSDGDGASDSTYDTVSPDNVRSLWKAGRLLWGRNIGTTGTDPLPRTLYTHSGISGVDDGTTGLVPLSDLATNASNATTIENLMQTTSGEKQNLVDYIYGNEISGFRSRTVTIKSCSADRSLNCTTDSDCGTGTCNNYTSIWRLGDIISSTPKLVSNVRMNNYNLPTPTGYNDSSYKQFSETTTYKNRGMVFVGGNDGMLHAFKLGILKELSGKYTKAAMVNTSGVTATASDRLGMEMWSFIPRNTLPYLTYLKDPNYCHLNYIDKTSTVTDVSIACNSSSYWDCPKSSSTWKTVLVGGMGTGGACRNATDACGADGCVKTPVTDAGFSSYFALDVTDPENPSYMWEFPSKSVTSHADAIGTGSGANGGLGFSTTGPAIVRIAARVKNVSNVDTDTPDNSKNGRWFAVFASGPTGPLSATKEFLGKSDQTLKIFIVDLKTGELVKKIDTGIANAFAGSLSTSVIDTERSRSSSDGHYSDDVVYIGYVKKQTVAGVDTWDKGGVLRLVTNDNKKESLSPETTGNWAWSYVVDDIGPVTTSVTKLQDRQNGKLWLFFGSGRYFMKSDDASTTAQQALYGIKEPCYDVNTNDIDATCTVSAPTSTTVCTNAVALATRIAAGTAYLCDQSGTASQAPLSTLPSSASGWIINLDQYGTPAGFLSERVITDAIASAAGAVFFTTLKPSADVCKYGGDSLVWAVRYDSGGVPPARAMQGKALMQVSTGAFAEISLSSAFSNPSDARFDGRRVSAPIVGVPPTSQGLALITNPPAVKKFLHVREK